VITLELLVARRSMQFMQENDLH